MIFRAVFVVKIAIIEKEMHSHKLSAMADNYPADWCINPNDCVWTAQLQDERLAQKAQVVAQTCCSDWCQWPTKSCFYEQ
jgi:hypothetical protein